MMIQHSIVVRGIDNAHILWYYEYTIKRGV